MVIPGIVYSQKKSDQPFKGATKIIITDTLSAASNFRAIGHKLNDLTFYIDRKDDEFKTLVSQAVYVEVGNTGTSGAGYYQTIYIVAKDHQIIVTSRFMTEHTLRLVGQHEGESMADKVEWSKKDKSQLFLSNVLKLVSDIPNATIEYSE